MIAAAFLNKPVVLRGLSADARPDCARSTLLPPRIGLVIAELAGGRLRVRLWMGSYRRWSPRARICFLTNVVREATAREAIVGMPIGPLPAVAS